MPRRKAISSFNLTIANGANLSNVVDLGGYQAVRIVVPASTLGTYIIFRQGEAANAVFNTYDQSGALVVAACAASRTIELDPIFFRSGGFFGIKSCSDNAGVAQNQSADIVYKLIVD